jgi:hypothetical protein
MRVLKIALLVVFGIFILALATGLFYERVWPKRAGFTDKAEDLDPPNPYLGK